MFPDSKIVNKYQGGRTNTTYMLAGATDGLATDGSSDEDDKLLPVSVRHVDKDSGLIAISLLDIPNINSVSTAQL